MAAGHVGALVTLRRPPYYFTTSWKRSFSSIFFSGVQQILAVNFFAPSRRTQRACPHAQNCRKMVFGPMRQPSRPTSHHEIIPVRFLNRPVGWTFSLHLADSIFRTPFFFQLGYGAFGSTCHHGKLPHRKPEGSEMAYRIRGREEQGKA